MMSCRLTSPFFLLFPLLLSEIAVAQNNWSVNFKRSFICAVRGSTVTMGCSYKPDFNNSTKSTAHKFYWKEYLLNRDLSSELAYKNRVQYLRETPNDCSLQIRKVIQQDQGQYCVTFKTSDGELFQDERVVELSVTALRVEMIPDRALEGDEVILKCITFCRPTETPTFTWYKLGRKFSSVHSSNLLRLPLVGQKDAGDYRCAVQENSYRSPAVILEVLFGDRQESADHVRNILVAVGVVLCGVAALLAGLFYMRRKRQKTSDDMNAAEDTYTPPDHISRSSNDMYNTLGNVYANSTNDLYAALDHMTRSFSDVYNTLAEVHASHPKDTYIAPDCRTISPDYANLPAPRM